VRRDGALTLLLFFLALRPGLWAAPAEKAYLESAIGLVHAQTDAGKARRVFDGQFVLPSETVEVGDRSQAVLQ